MAPIKKSDYHPVPKVDRNRKKIEREVDVDANQLDGYVPSVIKYLQGLVAANPGRKLYLEVSTTGYDSVTSELTYEEEESDEEYEERIAREEESAAYWTQQNEELRATRQASIDKQIAELQEKRKRL